VAEVARAPEIAPSQLEPGQLAGEYRIVSNLGRGTFGAVYRAVQPVIGKEVAVKVLNARFTQSADVVQRFAEEARAVNRIRHPNIVDVFAFGELPNGQKYYVMELLAGRTLALHLAERGALPVHEALDILRAIASALEAAHAQRILHRDLKPSNVFLVSDKQPAEGVKLLDFGVAKSLEGDSGLTTEVGVLIGTPAYMSPEQCTGGSVDQRSDIYALGVTAYELLTGSRPFPGPLSHQYLAQHLFEIAKSPSSLRPELPPSVDAALAVLLHKQPEQRPASAVLAIEMLERALAPGAAVAPAPRRGLRWLALPLLAAVLAMVMVWRFRAAPAAPQAKPVGVAVAVTPAPERPTIAEPTGPERIAPAVSSTPLRARSAAPKLAPAASVSSELSFEAKGSPRAASTGSATPRSDLEY